MEGYEQDILDYILNPKEVPPCRICYKTENADDGTIHDKYIITWHNKQWSLSVRDILSYLTRTRVDIDELPCSLCEQCCDNILKCFLFIKDLEGREQMWHETVNSLNILLDCNFEDKLNEAGANPPGNENKIWKSTQIKTNETLFQCSHCDSLYAEKESLELHSEHCIVSFLCYNCGEHFKSEKSHTEHRLNGCTYNAEKIRCEDCSNEFESQRELSRHKIYSCQKNCKYCFTIFASSVGLRNHMPFCSKQEIEKPYQCDMCKRAFSNKQKLSKHISSVHKERNKPCPFCGKLFKISSQVQAHMKVHTAKDMPPEKTFQCEQCEKTISKNSLLFYHKRVHTGERPHGCTLCEQRFISSNALSMHMKRVHIKPSLPCKVCGRLFKTPGQVYTHMNVHRKRNNFKCGLCDKTFGCDSALVYHQRLHTGEKPYPCTMCDERFLSASRRMTHMKRKHFGKTFACSMCEQMFYTNSDRKMHEEKHLDPTLNRKKRRKRMLEARNNGLPPLVLA